MLGLRSRLESQAETPRTVESAIEDRYYAAMELVIVAVSGSGSQDSGIYLLGYVAEMILKVGYFRLLAATGDAPLLEANIRDLLPPARARGRSLVPPVGDESYHSILFWAALLRNEHTRQRRDFDPAFASDFMGCCSRVYSTWWVEMRYHPNEAELQELKDVFDDVSWLLAKREELWR